MFYKSNYRKGEPNMSFQIMREVELTMVPTNILRDLNLSLATKGAAAVMFSYANLHCLSFWASERIAQLQFAANCRTQDTGVCFGCPGSMNFMIKRRNVAQPI